MIYLFVPILCSIAFLASFLTARRGNHAAWTTDDRIAVAWGSLYLPVWYLSLLCAHFAAIKLSEYWMSGLVFATACVLLPGAFSACVLREASESAFVFRGVLIVTVVAAAILCLPMEGFQVFVAPLFWNLGVCVALHGKVWPNADPNSPLQLRLKGKICRSCRYDVTGNQSGVCPECGTRLASQ